MTISRRPNKWPSMENAPGPSKVSAAAVMMMPKAMSLELITVELRAGGQLKAANTESPASKLAKGVKRPITREIPLIRSSKPSVQVIAVGLAIPERQRTP